jgi:hypothetical protein
MNTPNSQPLAAAQRFYAVHHGEHLQVDHERLVDRCTDHLVECLGLGRTAAQQAAREAWCELQNIGASAFVDLRRSTSQMVVLCDDVNRQQHVLPVAELLAMVRKRTEAVPA